VARRILTERLVLREWAPADARTALTIYGRPEVVGWLTPPVAAVESEDVMRSIIQGWLDEGDPELTLSGHWAAVMQETGALVGGLSLQRAAADDDDLSVTCALAPDMWGRGYAAEAAGALLRWAIHEAGATEVFAIVRRDNARAVATARRIGMEWVEDEDRRAWGHAHVFRLRHGDLGTAD
jgi:RimJ/RimL family protein N-acetyltransferase